MREPGVSLRYVLALGGAAVLLNDQAVATMTRFRQTYPRQKEVGGQLFGQFDGSNTIIVEATPPNWLDHRRRATFRPNRWLQQREIRNRHSRGFHFIGDWHTHPELVPRPSHEDLQNMKDCFDRSLHDLHAFVMIIIGTALPPDGLHVSLIQKDTMQTMVPEARA